MRAFRLRHPAPPADDIEGSVLGAKVIYRNIPTTLRLNQVHGRMIAQGHGMVIVVVLVPFCHRLPCPCFFFTQLCVVGNSVGVIIEFRPIYYERTETLSDFRFYPIVPPVSGYAEGSIESQTEGGGIGFSTDLLPSLCN